MPSYDPAPAATLLGEAWRSGRPLGTLPEHAHPKTMREAYDVQDCLVRILGGPVIGWKLGLGSRKAKQRNGIESPIFGRIFAEGRYEAGETVSVPSAMTVAIEFEIAFILARDIAAQDIGAKDIGAKDIGSGAAIAVADDLVSARHAAFEIVVSRMADHGRLTPISIAADNGMAHAVVVGAPIDLAAISVPELARTLTISVNGEEAARGAAGDDLVDPAMALEALLLHVRTRDLFLEKGALVMTGALSAPVRLAPASGAHEIVARYRHSELRCTVKGIP